MYMLTIVYAWVKVFKISYATVPETQSLRLENCGEHFLYTTQRHKSVPDGEGKSKL